ncbi:MAG: family 10 glycosylhydrolase, partial [Leptolyngbyaceae cyanobacterium SU_3_3]|nr:family 10 glycosylhydrolase [Leptolyngbyaceae cyanobacterium SU_3_3]
MIEGPVVRLKSGKHDRVFLDRCFPIGAGDRFWLCARFWVVVALWQAPIVPVTKTSEIRGVWMTNRSASLMHYTTRLDETMANLARHRLNTLYPCVWNRGQTLHPSGVFQRASRTGRSLLAQLPGYDVLSGLVQQGHRQHLRVIPWFEYGLMIPIR